MQPNQGGGSDPAQGSVKKCLAGASPFLVNVPQVAVYGVEDDVLGHFFDRLSGFQGVFLLEFAKYWA